MLIRQNASDTKTKRNNKIKINNKHSSSLKRGNFHFDISFSNICFPSFPSDCNEFRLDNNKSFGFSFLRFQNDLMGQNLLNFTHPEDQAFLKQLLIPSNLDKLFDSQPEDANGEPRPRTEDEETEIDRQLKEDKRNFTIRFVRRPGLFSVDFPFIFSCIR